MKPALDFLNNPIKKGTLLLVKQDGNGQKDSFQSSLENLNVGFLYLIWFNNYLINNLICKKGQVTTMIRRYGKYLRIEGLVYVAV